MEAYLPFQKSVQSTYFTAVVHARRAPPDRPPAGHKTFSDCPRSYHHDNEYHQCDKSNETYIKNYQSLNQYQYTQEYTIISANQSPEQLPWYFSGSKVFSPYCFQNCSCVLLCLCCAIPNQVNQNLNSMFGFHNGCCGMRIIWVMPPPVITGTATRKKCVEAWAVERYQKMGYCTLCMMF